jgi:hypothetical protein
MCTSLQFNFPFCRGWSGRPGPHVSFAIGAGTKKKRERERGNLVAPAIHRLPCDDHILIYRQLPPAEDVLLLQRSAGRSSRILGRYGFVHDGGGQAARRAGAVPGARPRRAARAARARPPGPRRPRHACPHRAAPPPPPARPGRRGPRGRGRPRRRGHPGRAVAGRPAADAAGAPRGDGAQLPRAAQGAAPGHAAGPARRAAGHLRGRRHPDAVRGRRGACGRRPRRAVLHGVGVRPHLLPPVPGAPGEGGHPSQARLRKRRLPRRAAGVGAGDEGRPAQGHANVLPHHGRRRVAGALPHPPDADGCRLRGHHPQHVLRHGEGRRRRARAAPAAPLHRRSARGRHSSVVAAVFVPPGERRHQPPAGGQGVHGVARRQGGALRRVPELRQPRQHERRTAAGVRGRAGAVRLALPLGAEAGHGRRGRGRRRGRARRAVVRAGGRAGPPGRGAVCDALWVELYPGERGRRRAGAGIPRAVRADDQLPPGVHGVGHRRRAAAGSRQRGDSGAGAGDDDREEGDGGEG